jgi:aliphatic sulfonates family ABC transporter substrate-binding protein
MSGLGRRALLGAGVAAGLALAAPAVLRAAAPDRLRMGFQRTGPILVTRQQRMLEALVGPRGTVEWHEFPSGPPLLEAMAAGAVDFGMTGEAPPVFAQAAGADIVYAGAVPEPGRTSGLLVHADSPIRTLEDLRGKRIGFARATRAHYDLVQALRHVGLGWHDVTPVNLAPADATAAFQQGAIDVWAIWDPYYAIAMQDPRTRLLADAQGFAPTNDFYLASRDFAQRAPDLLTRVVGEVRRASDWSQANPGELASICAAATSLPVDVERIVVTRADYGVEFMSDAIVAQQQGVADLFHALGLIPDAVRVRDAVWRPTA